ncbi:MAG: hypothetical protein K8R58_08865 [Bacteroidales bacterium]|nr:hypothetical protein [Bacteroidales bacterium]
MDYTNYNPLCKNRVINTACKYDEESTYEWWMTRKMYDEFIIIESYKMLSSELILP